MHPLLMEKSPTGVFSTAAPMPIETYPKTPSGTTAPNSCASLPAEGPMGTGTTPPTSSSPAHQRKQTAIGRTHKNRSQNLLLRFRPLSTWNMDLFYPAANACSYCVLKVIPNLGAFSPTGPHTVILYAAICE